MKILTIILISFCSFTLFSQECYNFNNNKDNPWQVGYFYDQGYNLISLAYKNNLSLIANPSRAGVLIKQKISSAYLEGQFSYKLRDVSDKELPSNNNNARLSAFYLFESNFEINPMVGLSFQEYHGKSLTLPEVGFLAYFQHLNLSMAVNHRILRVNITVFMK